MTRDKAMKEAVKRWGKKALIRAGEKLSTPEQREAALNILLTNRTRREAIEKEIQQRLNAEKWYQTLSAERKTCLDAIRQVEGWCSYYKFSVGHDVGIGFHVNGRGDTWEEAFSAADRATSKIAV